MKRSSPRPVCTPLSSPRIEASGKAAWMRSTISASLARSASVTRSCGRFSATSRGSSSRSHKSAPASFASAVMKASGSNGVLLGKGRGMRKPPSGQRDRVLAAIEIPALGVWLGALVGFAFVSAPLAFRIVAPLDVGRFAALTAQTLGALTIWGYVLGGIAILVVVLRSASAGDRTWDFGRAVLLALALGLSFYQQRAIVPAMIAAPDVHGDEYRALHQRSTQVYGAVVVFVFAALVLAAVRRD